MIENNLILELYYKNQNENAQDAIETQEYKDLSKRFDIVWDSLEKLNKSQEYKNLLSELDNIIGGRLSYEARWNYFSGFKNGANIMLNIIDK